ncbi:hypothetical protein P7C70_g3619, partial [Phenoliferia sp. Uapishka_3]
MSSAAVSPDEDEEEQCPVCNEDLSLRLEGEKPHIVPECGHRLHAACFDAVYGGVLRARQKGHSPGMCGICRRDMRIGEDGEGPPRRNKFAAISGLPQGQSDGHKMNSVSRRTHGRDDNGTPSHDPLEDDALPQLAPPTTFSSHLSPNLSPNDRMRQSTSTSSTGSTLTGGRRGSADTMKAASSAGGSSTRGVSGVPLDNGGIVKPRITVRAEHSSIARTLERDTKQHLTCMVTIEMPARFATPMPTTGRSTSSAGEEREREESYAGQKRGTFLSDHSEPYSDSQPRRPPSPTASSVYSAYAYTPTAGITLPEDPFASVVEELKRRMHDWKGHSPEEFGRLQLFDYIHVRKEKNVREFLVYLFEEAILCVADDKKKGLGKLVDNLAGVAKDDKLRLKGRVYVRHIRNVIDTSKEGGELSLTVTMSDDALDEFCMIFNDRQSLDHWKRQIENLVSTHRSPPPPTSSGPGRGAIGSISNDSVLSSEWGSDSSRSAAHSSSFSGYTRTTSSSAPQFSAVIQEEDAREMRNFNQNSPRGSTYSDPAVFSGSQGLQMPSSLSPPRDFTPLDLMLILSVPASGPTSLKIGIIKSSLEFILQSVGPRTRLSIVAFSVGDAPHGILRKTPFIAIGTNEGRSRMEAIINEMGADVEEDQVMIEHKEQRINVVTAVNLAFDIVLQRKQKSALTGIILMNDGKDGAQKQEMDLVMIRAEAANVPVHAIGWGRSHDPSSLWLLSNHTGGTYTFCREFYDLRDTLAGCIGGMLSIAATNVKLHISVPERRWFRIRKVAGTQSAIVSSDGKDVDVNIGELRFGERKDLLVEVEMSLAGYGDSFGQSMHERGQDTHNFNTATDAFFLSKVGLNPSALEDYQPSTFYEDEYDGMPDEVPLFQADASYRDPAAGKNISHASQSPVLLTITVIPPTPHGARVPTQQSAPEIVRRRIELLSSDMLARSLLHMSRRQDGQAKRLLSETKRIISTIMASLGPVSNSVVSLRGNRRSSYASAHALAYATLRACEEDVSAVLEGCSQRELFDTNYRNVAAQLAVVLRDQRSWTARSATERLFWTSDNSQYLVQRSRQFVSSRS